MRLALAVAAALLALPASAQQTSGSIEVESMLEGRKTITPDWQAINALPLGDKGNPVRVHMPPGQRAYLARLVCAGGGTPSFSRIGSFGVGPYGTIVDAYNVACGTNATRVFMDMYHPSYVERRPVPGFTIREP
jgi:hypothetical protein